MARAEASVVINRPALDVFACLVDVGNGSAWQAELIEAEQTSPGPVGLGTTIREARRVIGRRIDSVFEIVEYEPGSKLSFKSISSPFPIRAQYALEATDGDGTKLTFVVEAEFTGVFRMAEPMVAHSAKRQLDTDFAKLKQLLEAQA